MKNSFLFLFGLQCILLVACSKTNDDNTNNPPAIPRDWFKLKTQVFKSNNATTGNALVYDSTEVAIDSANNKVILRNYSISGNGAVVYYKDTSVETFTYNGNNQLVEYEHSDTYNQFFITNMRFERDANGQVTKVVSQYKDGLMNSSEGIVRYNKNGDTTFVTFTDSTKKHRQGYSDAQDYYQVAILKDHKIAYYKNYNFPGAGKLDSSVNRFDYDAAGNLTTFTYQGTYSTVYSYQRGSATPTELQKYFEQWLGDLYWFRRSNLFNTSSETGFNYMIAGNVVESIRMNNAAYRTFTNSFDQSGNLSSVTYQTTTGGSNATRINIVEQYKYRP